MILKGIIQDNLSGFFVFKRKKLFQLNLKSIFIGYGEYYIRLLYHSQKKNYSFKEIELNMIKEFMDIQNQNLLKCFLIIY